MTSATGRAGRPRVIDVARFGAGLLASTLLVAGLGFVLLVAGPAALPGRSATVVGSGSMTPALAVGDAVVVESWPAERGMLAAPAIILVDRPGMVPLLHRVVDDDGRTYRTRGDANPDPDSDRVAPDRVLGVARLVVPSVGYASLWAADGNVAALAALVGVVALLVHLARYGWSDRYDPWRLAAERAAAPPEEPAEAPDGPGGAGPDAPARPTGAAATTHAPRPTLPPRPVRLARSAGLVLVALLVTVVMADSSAAAFAAAATAEVRVAAASVAPVTGLGSTCTRASGVETATASGPGVATLPIPATVRAGDNLLLSRTGVRAQVDGAYVDPSAPAGWTRLGLATGGEGRFHAVYRRTAVAGDAGTSMPSPTDRADILVVARGGTVDDRSLAGRVYETGSTAVAPSVDGQAGGLLLTFWAAERNETAFSVPAGMENVTDRRFSSTISMSVQQQAIRADGPTGERSSAMTAADGSSVPATTRHSGLSLFIRSRPYAALAWTPSPTGRASGYRVLRDGVEVATVPGGTSRAWRDPNPLGGAASTYAVVTTAGPWTAPAVTTTIDAGGC